MRYFLHKDKSAHNEIRDFYTHMALTHERHFARYFCRYSGNIAMRYFRNNNKIPSGSPMPHICTDPRRYRNTRAPPRAKPLR